MTMVKTAVSLLLTLLALLASACTASEPQKDTTAPPTRTTVNTSLPAPSSTFTKTPAPSSTPTPLPSSTLTLPPTPTSSESPDVDYNGISFSFAPLLGDEVSVYDALGAFNYVEFSFGDGYCLDVGCVTVYPVQAYRDGMPGGDHIVTELQAAIDAQSYDYFPTIGAAILLRAQTRHLGFQGGAGIRAVVIRGQDGFFANNEALVYNFHGLSSDGQYYVDVTFPIDASLLISTFDPDENTNAAAFSVPELSDDFEQRYAAIREYNLEAQQQLDALDTSGFVPDLALLDALVVSLKVVP